MLYRYNGATGHVDYIKSWTNPTTGAAPAGLAIDSLDQIWIGANGTGSTTYLLGYDSSGKSLGPQDLSLDYPGAYIENVAVDANNNVFLAGYVHRPTGYAAWVIAAGTNDRKWVYVDDHGVNEASNFTVGADGQAYYAASALGHSGPYVVALHNDGSYAWSTEASELGNAQAIALDHKGNLYVLATDGNTNGLDLYRWNASGVAGNTFKYSVAGANLYPKAVSIDNYGRAVLLTQRNPGLLIQTLDFASMAAVEQAYYLGEGDFDDLSSTVSFDPYGGIIFAGTRLIGNHGNAFAVRLQQKPVLVNDYFPVLENSSLTRSVAQSEIANDHYFLTPTVNVVKSPAHGSLLLHSDGSFNYVPATDYVGYDAFTYTVTSFGVTSAVGTATINVLPLVVNHLTLRSTSISGGNNDPMIVSLNGYAPSGGAVITLTSSAPGVASCPSTVTIDQGHYQASTTVTTYGVPEQTYATFTASYNGHSTQTTLQVKSAGLLSVSVSPASVVGGNYATFYVRLDGKAPSGGTNVPVGSSNTSVANFSGTTMAIGGQASGGSMSVSTKGVASASSVTLNASLSGRTLTTTLSVAPASLLRVGLSSSSASSGAVVRGDAVLNGLAPPAGALVSLSSSSPAITVPPSVTVPAGLNYGTFYATFHSVAQPTVVTITATYAGNSVTFQATANP
jgi:hypothetical protein